MPRYPARMRQKTPQTDFREMAQRIKEDLPAQRMFELYGFHPNWDGYIICPFHNEDTPSLKIYSGEKTGWHCFGCGMGGSVIDFAMQFFQLNFQQACLRLNSDFGLGLGGPVRPPDCKELKALEEARRREAERKAQAEAEYRTNANEYCYWWEAAKHFAPEEPCLASGLHPLYAEALKRLPVLEYWLDTHL